VCVFEERSLVCLSSSVARLSHYYVLCSSEIQQIDLVRPTSMFFWCQFAVVLDCCMCTSICVQCESKNLPWGLMAIFSKRLGIFQPNFTCLLCVPIYARLRIFIQLPATLTKLCHIKRDQFFLTTQFTSCAQNVHHRPKCTLAFSDIFPKQLGIFSSNFTCLLNVYMYAWMQIFIQLPPTATKLCHIKCDHPACVSVDSGHFEHIMVVTLNMA